MTNGPSVKLAHSKWNVRQPSANLDRNPLSVLLNLFKRQNSEQHFSPPFSLTYTVTIRRLLEERRDLVSRYSPFISRQH